MHPQSGTTKCLLILCMVIVGILLLPLPYAAYGILKFLLSLGLLCSAGFFLRPCKKLSFRPSVDRIEHAIRDPYDGKVSGTLLDSNTREPLADLNEENSEIVRFLENSLFLCERNSLPPISLQLSLTLIISSVIMNPFTQVHLPRSGWMLLDVIMLALLGFAFHVIRQENAEERPHFPLSKSEGNSATFPFLTMPGVFTHAKRLWPAIVGGTFVLALLGTRIGESEFEDFSLVTVLGQTFSALLIALTATWIVYLLMEYFSNKGVQDRATREQVPGEASVTIFVLVLVALAFGGYFTPNPAEAPADYPSGYVPYDERF